MIEDDETRQERAERHYKTRRDTYLQNYAGATDEDMALLRETGILDGTDLNLISARVVKQGFDVLGKANRAKANRAIEVADEAVDLAQRVKKLFRFL